MVNKLKTFLLAVLAAGSLHAYANEGKVIAVVGNVVLVRDAQEIKAERGTVVRAGDLVKVAAESTAQLRMSDESIIALGQSTDFRINEYSFAAEKPAEGKAAFSLLKGAFRTVTGLIGRQARENYSVKAGAVATIGIRGTHYQARLCMKDCAVPGQEEPKDGLYGGVTEGRIGVTNDTGTDEFGADEYFYVADAATRPERLPGPPDLLLNRVNFLAKQKGGESVAPLATVYLPSPVVPGFPAIDTLSSLTQQQFRAAEVMSSPDALVHVTPLPTPGTGGFIDVGGSGLIRGQILWMTDADIDLHMIAPTGGEVYFGNKTLSLGGSATAQLDHDNLGGTIDVAPDRRIENIVVTGSPIPTGSYNFFARSFSGGSSGLPTNVQIRVTGDNNATSLTDTVTLSNGQDSNYYNVNYRGTLPPQYSVQPK